MNDKPKIEWTVEKIRLLSEEEVATLQQNAATRDNLNVVCNCEQVKEERRLAGRSSRKSQSGITGNKRQKRAFSIPENAIDVLANAILALPEATGEPNAIARLHLQKNPKRTLGDLWQQFIICGFSSQEDSEEGSALSRFVAANSPLLDLTQVTTNGCDEAWVTQQIRAHLKRQLRNKIGLVIGSYGHFYRAGSPTDLLRDLCREPGALKLFCDLARNDINDRELVTSAAFSRTIDHSAFPHIGNKQVRNILVNSGLAHNVVPLDSRWQKFFGTVLVTNKYTFQYIPHYLAVEDCLRSALIQVHALRPDIPNLAVLDALVFAQMSKQGIGPGGWFGITTTHPPQVFSCS